MRKELRLLGKRLAKLSVVLSLIFSAMAMGFNLWGSWALPDLAESLAEVAMERGQRREAAGNLEEARDFYALALAGKFHGEANRNHCEKRLGVVLYKLGDFSGALPCLERAQAGPLRSLNGFVPLVEVLLALERWDEAKEEIARWRLESQGDPATLAKVYRALGEIALHEGDLDGAQGHFQDAIALDAIHPARADLARLYAARGDIAKAREMMVAYLADAPLDEDTAPDWAMLETWMR